MSTLYAIDYVLGGRTLVLTMEAEDRDEAYDIARTTLIEERLFSASLQGSCRIASQGDLEKCAGRMQPNRALNRHQLETIAWQVTPERDRRGSGSRRAVLIESKDGLSATPLSELTDNQIRRYIGPKALEEGGDMRKNGSAEESFIEDLRSRLDIGDRFVNMRVPYPGTVFLQFYNVPTTHQTRSHGADQENNRIMLTFSGLNGPKAKVEATVLGPSFGGPDWRLRAKSGTPEKVAEYAAAFLNRAAQKKPYGFTFDNYEKNASGPKFQKGDRVTDLVGAMTGTVMYGASPNGPFEKSPYGYMVIEDSDTKHLERRWLESDLRPLTDGRRARRPERDSAGRKVEYNENASRSEPDETAARELSLYIENEYSLVGAPNSIGKSIEKNLLKKLQNGTFNLALSEKAWMYLMEAGAKKYSKEYSDGRDWASMFNKATRELVAHEFATTFYEENKGSR